METKKAFKFEFSAGGIVFKKENNQIYILVTQHSQHKGWVFPKGLIDKGETKEKAALREVREEGGVEAKIVYALEPTQYFYVFEGTKIKKTVYYFLMEYQSGNIEDHDFEMSDAKWILFQEVKDKLTYQSDKQIFQKVLDIFGEVA